MRKIFRAWERSLITDMPPRRLFSSRKRKITSLSWRSIQRSSKKLKYPMLQSGHSGNPEYFGKVICLKHCYGCTVEYVVVVVELKWRSESLAQTFWCWIKPNCPFAPQSDFLWRKIGLKSKRKFLVELYTKQSELSMHSFIWIPWLQKRVQLYIHSSTYAAVGHICNIYALY